MHNFFFSSYWVSLYTFRTVSPSIIRCPRLYIQLQVASKQSMNLYDIHVKLYVQSWTPDDGRKDRPKHVEWYSINLKIVHLVGFTVEIYHDAWSHVCQNRYFVNSPATELINWRGMLWQVCLHFVADVTWFVVHIYIYIHTHTHTHTHTHIYIYIYI